MRAFCTIVTRTRGRPRVAGIDITIGKVLLLGRHVVNFGKVVVDVSKFVLEPVTSVQNNMVHSACM